MINSRINNDDLDEMKMGRKAMNGVMESIDDEDIFKMNQHILTDSNQINNENCEMGSNYVNTDDEEDDYNHMKQNMKADRSQKRKSKKKK